jgi:ribonuclease Z
VGNASGQVLAALLLIAGTASCTPRQTAAAAENAPAAAVMTVTILGSGTPVPSRTQAGTAILIAAGQTYLLFDCGRGCTSRLAEHDPALIGRIDKLFLTHLHSDHTVGIPDLWLNGWTQGRQIPLRLWGPTGTDTMMEGLRRAYGPDIGYRTPPGAEEAEALRRETRIIDDDGVVYNEAGVKVTAFRVQHGAVPAFGYRVDYGGKSVLISGDTTATPALQRYGAGVTLALLEVASPSMVDYVQRSFPAEQAKYILSLHLTADQAGEAFAAMKPDLAVYYHTVSTCATNPALIAKTREHFTGRLEVSQDLMDISILPDRVETWMPASAETCKGR